jgi:pyruvate formate lyase activating enzyme
VLESIARAGALGMHVETRTNIIPGKNDDPRELADIARWIKDHLGADSPWHITRFFPAYKLAHLPETPAEIMWQAHDAARAIGLNHVYVYDDKGCDCAQENRPVETYLSQNPEAAHAVKKCPAACCGDEGVLLKKYEAGVGGKPRQPDGGT